MVRQEYMDTLQEKRLTMRSLTSEEQARVDAALYEDEALVVHLQTTEELHAFVEEYNYDDLAGFDYLIRHPNLAKGSALTLFWLSDPVYHFSRRESISPYLRGAHQQYQQLLVELQQRYVMGFYKQDIFAVNPREIAVGKWDSPDLDIPIAELIRQPARGESAPLSE